MSEDHEITGVYKFYLGGELIGEHKNSLTTAGRSIILKSLLGIIPDFVNVIAYGIDGTANTLNSASTLITNTTLGFEVGRSPTVGVNLSVSGTNDILVYYATINDPFEYVIHEVALFPSTDLNSTIKVDNSTIVNFDFIDDFLTYGSASTASLSSASQARIGTQMYSLPSTNATTNYVEKVVTPGELSFIEKYSSDALFKLALFNPSSSAASINFRFYKDDSNYYTVSFVSPSSSGYRIVNVSKGSTTIVGNPSWDSVSSIRIWNSSSHASLLDAVRIDRGPNFLDTNFGMVSRATLSVPIVKPASIPLTIEYNLMVNFSGGV